MQYVDQESEKGEKSDTWEGQASRVSMPTWPAARIPNARMTVLEITQHELRSRTNNH